MRYKPKEKNILKLKQYLNAKEKGRGEAVHDCQSRQILHAGNSAARVGSN